MVKRPKTSIKERLALAEDRRLSQNAQRIQHVIEHTGLDRHSRQKSASSVKRQERYSATLVKRQEQLQQIRDKIKEKNKKGDMIRLKHQLVNGLNGSNGFKTVHENGLALTATTGNTSDGFFDD